MRTSSPVRLQLALSAFAAVCALASPARAVGIPTVYEHHTTYPVGSRAAGMAGAYTALACDEAALHYNVAALSCARASRLELAANAYVIQHGSVPNAFGEGQDLDSTNYHSVPSIVGGVRILSEGDPKTGTGRFVLGFDVTVPKSVSLNVDPSSPDDPNGISASVRDAITAADIGLGYQLSPELAIGLSVGGLLRTYDAAVNSLYVARSSAACGPTGTDACQEFYDERIEEELLAVGLRAKLGIRWTPAPRWSFGLVAESPSLDVFGSSSVNLVQTFAVNAVDAAGNVGPVFGPIVTRVEGGADLGWPLRIAAGGAYSTKNFTLSADVSLNFPTELSVLSDPQALPIRGQETPTGLSDALLERTWQPNGALGVEVAVAEETVVNLGGFTDFSSVPDSEIETGVSDRVHQFGATAAVGLLGEQTRGWFGIAFKYGQGATQVPRGRFDLDTAFSDQAEATNEATITLWTLAGFIGSNYSFADDPDEDTDAGSR